MKKALYRKQICAEKEKLTPEKVFHTPQYRVPERAERF